MRPVLSSELVRVTIETGADALSSPHSPTCVDFVRREALPDGEAVSVCLGVSEFSLADVIGRPELLRTVKGADGQMQFQYRLRGALRPHRAL